ncbi:MAG: TetR/AcrR family transcriptional regulator [Actinomycetota bacterium]|nr:TetR/AcrR family transcriptional regulator [Actinomycetota bacterium]
MTRNTGRGSGLREHKRAATEAAIESAAISLALEHGYENVTVEMICDAGKVSQRTFFNYFGSKEGVILGATPPTPTEEQIQRFVEGEGANVLGDLVGLITALMVDHEPDMQLLQFRRMLIQQTPELMSKERARIGEVEGRLAGFVVARFHAQGRNVTSTPDLEDEARMMVALAAGAMHYAMQKWVGSNFTSTRRELMQNTSDMIRRITSDAART